MADSSIPVTVRIADADIVKATIADVRTQLEARAEAAELSLKRATDEYTASVALFQSKIKRLGDRVEVAEAAVKESADALAAAERAHTAQVAELQDQIRTLRQSLRENGIAHDRAKADALAAAKLAEDRAKRAEVQVKQLTEAAQRRAERELARDRDARAAARGLAGRVKPEGAVRLSGGDPAEPPSDHDVDDLHDLTPPPR